MKNENELLEVGQRVQVGRYDGRFSSDDDFGVIVEVDMQDRVVPYFVEKDNGDHVWKYRRNVRAVPEYLEEGQRVVTVASIEGVPSGKHGSITLVDKDDNYLTYYVAFDDGDGSWISRPQIALVEESEAKGFKKGDIVTVDYPQYFEPGKPYVIKNVNGDEHQFEGTHYVANENRITLVDSPGITVQVKIEGSEDIKEILDELDKLSEVISGLESDVQTAKDSTFNLREMLTEAVHVETEEVVVPDNPRKTVIENAKTNLSNKYGSGRYIQVGPYCTKPEFIINEEKQTVVVLLHGVSTGKVRAKGKAKASHGDVFNVHIGKAIAMAKALGKSIPDEFINAPQPERAEVGMRTRAQSSGDIYELTKRAPQYDGFNGYGRAFHHDGGTVMWIGENQIDIIDDSNASYSKGGK